MAQAVAIFFDRLILINRMNFSISLSLSLVKVYEKNENQTNSPIITAIIIIILASSSIRRQLLTQKTIQQPTNQQQQKGDQVWYIPCVCVIVWYTHLVGWSINQYTHITMMMMMMVKHLIFFSLSLSLFEDHQSI